MRLPRYAALCLLLLLPCTARADDIGTSQAQALEQQLKDWFQGLMGPSVKLPDLPWRITGHGDHYTIDWPISGLDSPSGGVVATATVRPLEADRWSIDAVDVPPAAAFTLTIPTDDKSVGGPVKLSYTVGKQDTHGIIDTSLHSASSLHTEVGDLSVISDGMGQHQEQHFDRYLVDTSLKPAGDGRLGFALDAIVDGWKSAAQMNGGTPVAIGIQTMHAVGRVDSINPDRVGNMLTAVGGLVGAFTNDAMAQAGHGELPAPAKNQLHMMIAALPDMLTGVSLEETLDGLEFEMAGVGELSMKHFQLGFGGDAPDGKLHVWFDVGMNGLDSPSLPPKLAAYLPHHVEIKPTLSGILTADLEKLAQDAAEDSKDSGRLTSDIAAIFAHGGAKLGIETLSFDLGPAQVEGTGEVTALSPDMWRGEAHLVATGFDDLTTQARGNPDLQQALPVLIMMRGLARPDGPRLVWDIVSDGPKVSVNGLDLSQLGGGDKKAKPGQQPRR